MTQQELRYRIKGIQASWTAEARRIRAQLGRARRMEFFRLLADNARAGTPQLQHR